MFTVADIARVKTFAAHASVALENARLYEAQRETQQAELSAARRSQIGTGERAEKIRTYNYPDSRATDHRVKVTLNLEKVLPGGLDEFTEALQAEDRRQALQAAGT